MRGVAGKLLAAWFRLRNFLWCTLRGSTAPRADIGENTILLNCNVWKSRSGNNEIVIGRDCTIRGLRISFNGNNNHIHVADRVRIYEGLSIEFDADDCELRIGAQTTVGEASMFFGESATRISFGGDCMLSRGIRVSTSDYHAIRDRTSGERLNPPRDVTIADRVWIGNGVLLNKGAAVGAESVIASRAVVSKAYPQTNVIIAGVPGRVIRENIVWSRDKY